MEATTTPGCLTSGGKLNRGPQMAVILPPPARLCCGKGGGFNGRSFAFGSDTLIDPFRQRDRQDSSVRAIRLACPQPPRIARIALRRDLARAGDHEGRACRSPARVSFDVRSRRVGRLLDGDGRAPSSSRSPRRSPDRLAFFAGKMVTGGVYDEARRAYRHVEHGSFAEMQLAGREYNPEQLKKLQEQSEAFENQFVEKAGRLAPHDAGEDRPDSAGTGRTAPGEAEWPRRLARRPRPRDRRRQTSREDPPTIDVEIVMFPRRRALPSCCRIQFSGTGESAVSVPGSRRTCRQASCRP